MTRIATGSFVRGRFGREGIAISSQQAPPRDWLAKQEGIDSHARGPWWTVCCVGGGAVLSPEQDLRLLRRTTCDDFLKVVDTAEDSGRRQLAQIFPDYVRRVVRRSNPDSDVPE